MAVLPFLLVLWGGFRVSGNPSGLPKVDSPARFRVTEATTPAGIDGDSFEKCFSKFKLTEEMTTRLSMTLLNCISLPQHLPKKFDAIREAKHCQSAVVMAVEEVAEGVDGGLRNPVIGESMDRGLTSNVTDVNAETIPSTEEPILEREKRSTEDHFEDEASDEEEWEEEEDDLGRRMRSFPTTGSRLPPSLRASEEGSAEAVSLLQGEFPEEEEAERIDEEAKGKNGEEPTFEKYRIEERTRRGTTSKDEENHASRIHSLLLKLEGKDAIFFLTNILSGRLGFDASALEGEEENGISNTGQPGEADSSLHDASAGSNPIFFPDKSTTTEPSTLNSVNSLLWDMMKMSLSEYMGRCAARGLGLLNGSQHFDTMLFKEFISKGFENEADPELLILNSLIDRCNLTTQSTEEKDRPRELLVDCLQTQIVATCRNGGELIDRTVGRPEANPE